LKSDDESKPTDFSEPPTYHDLALLGVSGAAILLSQYITVREIGSSFFSTELVIFIAVFITLTAPSIGYAIAHKVSSFFILLWGLASIAFNFILPFGLRAFVGIMTSYGYEGGALGIIIVLGVCMTTSFYAIFLPRLSRPTSFSITYTAELGGALLGIITLVLSPSWRFTLAIYWSLSAAIVYLALRSRILTGLVAVTVFALTATYPILDREAAIIYYKGYYGIESPYIVETNYSPYQRIDIVSIKGFNALFLDGVAFYYGKQLYMYNEYLADLPASLRPPGKALVIGSGSFSSSAYLHRRGYDVTVVDIDAKVASMGFHHFSAIHKLKKNDVHIVTTDGRKFLNDSPPSTYDAILMDVPAPFHIRTALLFTSSFYQLVKSRLKPGGFASLCLSGMISDNYAKSIAAAARAAFPSTIIAACPRIGLTFCYAGDPLPFTSDDIRNEVKRRHIVCNVIDESKLDKVLYGVRPLDEGNLSTVVAISRGILENAFRTAMNE